MDISQSVKKFDIVLCKFYFSDLKSYKQRPVLIFKENLPYDDCVCIAISSQVDKLHDDEFLINSDMLSEGLLPKNSKLMIRKTFILEKNIILKKYGSLKPEVFEEISKKFCSYYKCNY